MRIKTRVVMRQLAITLLSACLIILPMSAHALGFGNIRIKSALNEPLDAEIELLSATTSDLKGLKIKLATREAFLRAGIERPSHLSQLKFSIKRRANGRAYLKIITKQSIREPFLDFLLEMNWKNGRMLREYTVLLDPPDRVQPQPTIVESPQTEAPVVVAEQEQQDSSSPFVGSESVVVEEVQVEPEPTFVEPVQIESEVVVDEPIVAESIAAADVEDEPVPLAETVPESELQFTEEASVTEDISIAQVDETVTPAEADPIDEAYVDPFEGEKFPRIPIKTDKRLRQAEETELANIEVEPAQLETLEGTPLAEELLLAEEPLQEAPLEAEAEMLADESAVAEQPEYVEDVAVDSVTTQRNDNLWNIAKSMHADESVSIYQVMMALLQSNPEAFTDGNVHRLKVGKVLRIDDPSLLTAMSQSQAAQEYISQTQAWEDYRQQFADSSSTPVQTAMVGEIDSRESEVLSEQLMAEASGELVLAAPEGDNQTSGSSGEQQATVNNEVVILREQIRQALAEADAEGNRNIILNEKLRDLENQLQGLQRSVTVQDDELALLQTQLSELNKKNFEAEQAEIATAHSEIPEVMTSPESTDSNDAVMSETELLAQVEQEELANQTMTETVPVEESESVIEPAQDSGPGVMDKTFGLLDNIKQSLSSIVSSLPVSPLILAIGTGVIVVLLLLMLLLVQRRRQAANFQESILSGIPSHEIMASEEASLDTNLSGESSFLSDFAISGASALQGDDGDVDPLTEADVFMAYGRYEAAEERILEAIKKDPDRQELRIKLLELYNTTKNKTAFESAAEELYSNLGNDAANPLWQKVVAMGAILAADNPLFSDLVGEDATRIQNREDVTRIRNQPQANENTEDLLDLDFNNTTLKDEPAIDNLGLDLDFASDNDTSAALDFDLESGGEETAEVKQSDELDLKFDTESMQLDSSALDFEIPTDDSAKVSSPELDMAVEETAETEIALDFDINEIDGGVPELDLNMESHNESSLGLTLDLEVDTAVAEAKEDGLTMEISQPTLGDIEMPTIEAEVDAADIAELDTPSAMDEVGTKLDLAKAYIDMGDPDGAKSILDEVLEEGTQPQQQEAQQLMQQI